VHGMRQVRVQEPGLFVRLDVAIRGLILRFGARVAKIVGIVALLQDPGSNGKGDAVVDGRVDEEVGLCPLDGILGGLVGHNQRPQDAGLLESGHEEEGVAGGVVDQDGDGGVLREAEDAVAEGADKEADDVGDDAVDQDDQVAVSVLGVQLGSDLGDEQGWQEDADTHAGDGAGVLPVDQLQTGCEASIGYDQEDTEAGLDGPKKRLNETGCHGAFGYVDVGCTSAQEPEVIVAGMGP